MAQVASQVQVQEKLAIHQSQPQPRALYPPQTKIVLCQPEAQAVWLLPLLASARRQGACTCGATNLRHRRSCQTASYKRMRCLLMRRQGIWLRKYLRSDTICTVLRNRRHRSSSCNRHNTGRERPAVWNDRRRVQIRRKHR